MNRNISITDYQICEEEEEKIVQNATLLGRERSMHRNNETERTSSCSGRDAMPPKSPEAFRSMNWWLKFSCRLQHALDASLFSYLSSSSAMSTSGSRNLIFFPNSDCYYCKSNSMCISYSFYDLSSVVLLSSYTYSWSPEGAAKRSLDKYKPVQMAWWKGRWNEMQQMPFGFSQFLFPKTGFSGSKLYR